jgi:hypothetical protein
MLSKKQKSKKQKSKNSERNNVQGQAARIDGAPAPGTLEHSFQRPARTSPRRYPTPIFAFLLSAF